ncbi:solute carrier organic anion transporter family member 4C1-like isoform X2 [Mytilus edulis]|uniref:solute carrier organic anion transporter family member 4C1-like isoform X2 n=1 Tax=Mytilus edulis TaxID=6550 RepID=UPI0039F0B56E
MICHILNCIKFTKREPDDGCYGEDIDDPIVELLPLTAGYDISPDSMQEENTKQNGIGLDKLEEAYLERPESERSSSLSDPAIRCGYFTYSPDWLQYWNNPKSLLFFLCCLSMVQGFVVNGINNVNTSTIERRFELPSSRVGTISSAYDVSAAILGIVISYFGSGRNKPRLIACAAIVMSIGSFMMALPHFTTGPYQWGQNSAEKCKDPSIVPQCTTNSDLQNYLYVFLLGQALHGVGGTTLYIVGVALLDDSVPASSSPMYVGVLYAFATLGPALGYIVGGQFLNIYVDYHVAESDGTGLSADDPRWVGAWWIGFICSFLLFLVFSLPLFGFGKELPTAKHVRATRVSQVHGGKDDKDLIHKDSNDRSLREFPKAMWGIISNPTFLLITLAGTGEGLATSGFATFMPKLIQNQFGITASWASMLGGLMAVPGAAGGQFIGGLVCKRWKLKIQGMLRLNIIVCIAAMILDTVVWIRCPEDSVAGVNIQYNISNNEMMPQLAHSCNSNCSCSTEFYEPMCTEDMVQYFSPCFAGCSNGFHNGESYTNCTCMHHRNSGVPKTMTATVGRCKSDCYLLYIFLPLLLFAIFFRFMQSPPALSATLRCIHDNQRTFALGIQWFIARLLGTVPGPIFFGAIIDSTCLVWQENDCGDKKSCYIYDNASLSSYFFIILVSVKIFTASMFILAYKIYKPPSDKCITTVIKKPEESNGFDSICSPEPKSDSTTVV